MFDFGINIGEAAGQSVFHCYTHVNRRKYDQLWL